MKATNYLFLNFIMLLLLIFAAQTNAQKNNITIKNAWARPATEGANSALFFVIENNGARADTLLSAESNAADIVEVHETYKKQNDMMGMREVKFVPIPANSKVEFKPRSLHVMLLDVQKDLMIGGSLEATLVFKSAGKIKLTATVQDMPKMNTQK